MHITLAELHEWGCSDEITALTALGWTDADQQALLDQHPAILRVVAGDLLAWARRISAVLPDLPPAEVRAWMLMLFTDAGTRTPAVDAWAASRMDGPALLPVVPYADAAAADHVLARAAFAAGLTCDELTRQVSAGTADLKAIRALAALTGNR